MKESTLWKHLSPFFNQRGKFQKIADRFTPGIPDVLGVIKGRMWAMEFKQPDRFSASVVRLKFRAGQVPQLEGWLASGAVSVVLTIHRNILYVHSADMAGRLADGVTQEEFEDTALSMLKTRGRWKEVVEEIILVAETL